jgi:hypothetical protein
MHVSVHIQSPVTDEWKKMPMTWEREILRKIYAPACENGHWRIKINSDLESNHKSQDIISVIKARRLERLGHIIRMNEARTVKEMFEEKLEERKEEGNLDSGGMMMRKTI